MDTGTEQFLVILAFYAISAALLVHIAVLYLVVKLDWFGLGIFGGAISLAIGNSACALFLLTNIWMIEPGTWYGWTWECLDHVDDFLRIAVPSAGCICLEWWCFEITVVAAQTIMFNTAACTYLFGLGIAML